jgi:hypothetical protein
MDLLPVEIIVKIVGYIDVRSWFAVLCSCRRLYAIACQEIPISELDYAFNWACTNGKIHVIKGT